jgi:hypothetical protein
MKVSAEESISRLEQLCDTRRQHTTTICPFHFHQFEHLETALLMDCFADLPDDVLVDGILPYLDSASIDSLGSVSQRLNVLTKDQAFWRRKIRLDFGLNFDLLFDVDRPLFGFARRLWKGLRNPVRIVRDLQP